MRPVETYVMYASMYICLGNVPVRYFATVALLVFMIWHCAAEGPRLQLIPAYGVAAYFIQAILFAGEVASESSGWLDWLLVTTLFQAILWSTAAAACLMPVAKLTSPSGKYSTVGCLRAPLKFVGGDTKREGLHATFFYPSSEEAQAGVPAKYSSWKVLKGLASFAKLPSILFHHISYGNIPALEGFGLPKGDEKYPVLIFSHGLGGHPDVYASVALELASHGYVVVMPVFTDGSAGFSSSLDGSILPYVPLTPEEASDDQLEFKRRNAQNEERVAQVLEVVSSLRQLPEGELGFLRGRLDLDQLGVYGHSFGAATALTAAVRCKDIKAVAVADLWSLPLSPDVRAGYDGPLLSVTSPTFLSPRIEAVLKACSSPDKTCIVIEGTMHQNFSDLALFSKMVAKKFKKIGSLDLRRGLGILNAFNLAFFDKHLKGSSEAMDALSRPGEMVPPEVLFQQL